MIVIVSEHGAKIGKEGERLYISYPSNEKPVNYIPIINLEQLVIESKASLTSGAIDLLTSHGVPTLFFKGGKPVGILHSFAAHGTVAVRRAQILANTNPTGTLFIVKILQGAILNKANLLRRIIKNRQISETFSETIKNKIAQLIKLAEKDFSSYTNQSISFIRDQLFAYEGHAAEIYFSVLKMLLGEKFQFNDRNRRPPRDPINSMLSYGYAILTMKVLAGVIIAGLEPYAGFLHTDRSGKPSFVLDLMEEFRQPIVDRLVLKLEGLGMISPNDFEQSTKFCKMNDGIKKTFLTEIYNAFETSITNNATSELMSFEQHIIHQARKAGKFFKGDISEYQPFILK